jgi:hypothetical protein
VEERSEAVLQNMTRQDREAIERGLAALRAATDRVARSL